MTSNVILTGPGGDIGPRDPAMGEYSLVVPPARCCSEVSGDWRVVVRVNDHLVSRRICNGGRPWSALTGDGTPSIGIKTKSSGPHGLRPCRRR